MKNFLSSLIVLFFLTSTAHAAIKEVVYQGQEIEWFVEEIQIRFVHDEQHVGRRLPSKRWRDLILRVWHVDPLRCPVCQSPMRVIAVIDDPQVVETILRHLGAWHDPPACRSLGSGKTPPAGPRRAFQGPAPTDLATT